MNFLVGYGNRQMSATIASPKEDVDYQLWYRRRNKVIEDNKNIKDKE